MPKQQLKFAIIFITLGTVLGWFSHSAFNSSTVELYSSDRPLGNSISFEHNKKLSVKMSPLKVDSEIEKNKSHFNKFLDSNQFEKALLWYKEVENNHGRYLLPLFLRKVEFLAVNNNTKALNLLDVFLEEYYSSTIILVSKANTLVLFDQIQPAFDAFFLAKNYAKNDQEYNNIIQSIHELSMKIYQRYKSDGEWKKNIQLFSFLAESEPQFSFYKMVLAESYLKVGENDLAMMHLQLISEDVIYGREASEMLEMLMLSDNSNRIELKLQGKHYIVDSLLADLYEVKLMIDTGASYSTLSSYVIAQLVNNGLAEKVGQKQVYTAGGKIEVDVYNLKKMSIGFFSVNDIIVAELDLESTLDGNNSLDGLLGVNFLNQFDFSIDQQNKQLILNSKN